MQLYIGGSYAGKRIAVNKRYENSSWLSSYNGNLLLDWKSTWLRNTHLVIEGWEYWLKESIHSTEIDKIRQQYKLLFQEILEEEAKRDETVILIMLEIGKGIVPINETDRKLRDVAGWIQQDAAEAAKEVFYVWHGLEKRLK
ncbi:bifunctional adenosylcobinamide kinase/adenosylcobinamide-phosphate guanylyltransferase [Salipaludibacillus sp. CF4.18]|uniref:bifunctional adenosylcobinamide kinase/adenosylcobinamide-phosphate guanylyltransferase n=1 Tax=Salipaludibacillus sp. CF4.18 TaxID=3373081 RepID=UPI003EE4DDD9